MLECLQSFNTGAQYSSVEKKPPLMTLYLTKTVYIWLMNTIEHLNTIKYIFTQVSTIF